MTKKSLDLPTAMDFIVSKLLYLSGTKRLLSLPVDKGFYEAFWSKPNGFYEHVLVHMGLINTC